MSGFFLSITETENAFKLTLRV